ncbi:unnamed protein product [Callosobruchus maculatus]|uniref:Thioredoxin n=1 Tax=Callosobruchus maculatus TaxID=64391 RepID=A0A653DPH6_CALMS|nr:unnamed protein product [Callosobruchus maculatus]
MVGTIAIATDAAWQAELKNNGDKLMAVKFGAEWCSACKKLQPMYVETANKFPDIRFIEIDVDKLPDLAAELGVSSIPATFLLRNGKVVDQVMGVNPGAIGEKIQAQLKAK